MSQSKLARGDLVYVVRVVDEEPEIAFIRDEDDKFYYVRTNYERSPASIDDPKYGNFIVHKIAKEFVFATRLEAYQKQMSIAQGRFASLKGKLSLKIQEERGLEALRNKAKMENIINTLF